MASLDQVFDLLSEERRRYALYYLEQQDAPVSVSDVVEQVAKWEANPTTASVPHDKYKKLEIQFLHNELPKASELNYIEYDPDEGMVDIKGSPPEFDAILSVARVVERPNRHP